MNGERGIRGGPLPDGKPTRGRTLRGEISVFLALCALLIFSLFGTLLESSRLRSVGYLATQAVDSAVESVFANFDCELLEEFGLLAALAAEGGAETWLEDCAFYAGRYLAPGNVSGGSVFDEVMMTDLSMSEAGSVRLTEDGGRVFADAVLSYMKTAGVVDIAKEVLSRFGLLEEGGLSSLGETLQSFLGGDSLELSDLLGNYEQLKENVQNYTLPVEAETPDPEQPEQPAQPAQPARPGENFSGLDLLEQIKSIAQFGLLPLLTGTTDLSLLSWQDDQLPSHLSRAEKNQNFGVSKARFTLGEKLLLGEYARGKMSNYTKGARDGYRYEWEYVITGKSSETDCLSAVIARILLIRTGLNFVYLLTDAEKLAVADAAAAAIVGVLAIPAFFEPIKWILVAAWAVAEGIGDVQLLLRGKTVTLYKSKNTWRLSAISLEGGGDGGDRYGLIYEDYLRLLFYLTPGEDAAYRMMDVVQKRLSLLKPGVLMKNYMVSATVSAEITVDSVYLRSSLLSALPAVRQGWRLKRSSHFAY